MTGIWDVAAFHTAAACLRRINHFISHNLTVSIIGIDMKAFAKWFTSANQPTSTRTTWQPSRFLHQPHTPHLTARWLSNRPLPVAVLQLFVPLVSVVVIHQRLSNPTAPRPHNNNLRNQQLTSVATEVPLAGGSHNTK